MPEFVASPELKQAIINVCKAQHLDIECLVCKRDLEFEEIMTHNEAHELWTKPAKGGMYYSNETMESMK